MELLELVIVIQLGLLGGLRSGQVEGKIVHTSSGIVQGFEDAGTHQFLGIPFAEAPIGERRFKRPVWKTRMPGIYNASSFGPRCPQTLVNNPIVDPNDKMEEDCLYLNIYTPLNTSVTSSKTVMVWIHGGSFTMGSGQDYPGTMLALRNDVVVVNTNYRLGALGFLSTMDNNALGNFGLWDQTMALEWVKVNIAAFGGNPDSVTVFGESAGSASVTLLALSPFTEGLFRRVIAQSGSAFASWSISPDPLKASSDLGKRLGCPSATNDILIRCLRHQSVQDIVESQHLITPGNAFTAALGTEFLPFSPTELITTQMNSTVARKLAEVDFLIGQNTDEAAMFFKLLLAPLLDAGELVDDFTGISQKIFDTFMANSLTTYTQGDPNLAQKLVAPFTFICAVYQSPCPLETTLEHVCCQWIGDVRVPVRSPW
ncbi:putative inactive carboxylesterase 4 [Liolophura sinensis]|uniref:putative inactive carboxylesterase 4 n=1 Tax=Liolophura sinensis TaxID=3198878 RepID=UPI0031589A14